MKRQCIDKSDVIAKIEEWRDKIKKGIISIPLSGSDRAYATFEYEILGKVIQFLNTLEVKEVDLNDEIDKWICDAAITHEDCSVGDVISTAKHFFELGLKAKGE